MKLYEVGYSNVYVLTDEDDNLLAVAKVLELPVLAVVHVDVAASAESINDYQSFLEIKELLQPKFPKYAIKQSTEVAVKRL